MQHGLVQGETCFSSLLRSAVVGCGASQTLNIPNQTGTRRSCMIETTRGLGLSENLRE